MSIDITRGYPVVSYSMDWRDGAPHEDYDNLFYRYPIQGDTIIQGTNVLGSAGVIWHSVAMKFAELYEVRNDLVKLLHKASKAPDPEGNFGTQLTTELIKLCYDSTLWDENLAHTADWMVKAASEHPPGFMVDWTRECDKATEFWGRKGVKFPAVTPRNLEVLKNEVHNLNAKSVEGRPKLILEIGVDELSSNPNVKNENRCNNFTQTILREKSGDVRYVGLDLMDRSYILDQAPNVGFMQCNSRHYHQITEKLFGEKMTPTHDPDTDRLSGSWVGLELIDLLLIDGDHSQIGAISDFRYANYMAPGGVILMHDTNYHPGPSIVLECIDGNNFSVEKLFESDPDFGFGRIVKL